MKLVWSPDSASNAYIDTVQACKLYQESGVAELISAMAAGWNAKLIVETWQQGGVIATSVGLAIAGKHTGGRHVCVVPDVASRAEYLRLICESSAGASTEVVVGDAEEVLATAPSLEGVDFLVVDTERGDFGRVLRRARLGERGAVLMCKNASSKAGSGFRWRSLLASGGYRVVRTAFLPVGQGLDMAHIGARGGGGGGGGGGGRRWVKHVDQRSGEEHVIRTSRSRAM